KPRHIDLSKDERQREYEWNHLIPEWLTIATDEDIALRGDERFVKKLSEVALESGEQISTSKISASNPDANIAITFETGEGKGNWSFNLKEISSPEPNQLR